MGCVLWEPPLEEVYGHEVAQLRVKCDGMRALEGSSGSMLVNTKSINYVQNTMRRMLWEAPNHHQENITNSLTAPSSPQP